MTEKQWHYVNVSSEQIEMIDALIEYARGRGIHRSRPDIVATAIAEFMEKPATQEKIRSVSRKDKVSDL